MTQFLCKQSLKLIKTNSSCPSGTNVSIVHSVAFTAPSSPVPARLSPTSAQPGQIGKTETPKAGMAGLELLAQKRLEQTSTSLEAALRVVENKLAQGSSVDG